ncbi:uncharacterized protein [Aquarana catesbeiana]|uniref:uncharacterized protein n=1 Tax=Aquarana catesbeiana TaxID=8400 RepID=UPI003CCA56AC
MADVERILAQLREEAAVRGASWLQDTLGTVLQGSEPLPGPAASRICVVLLATLEHIADRFGIPLAPKKTEGPSTVISFLGIVLDSVAMECRLQEDKLADLKREIAGTMYHYSEIRTGSIVCEDIPECIEPPECEIIYVVTGCSTTRQDTTNDCEPITEEPTDCDSTTNSQPTTEFSPFSFTTNITQVSHTPTMSEETVTGTKEPTSTDSTATGETVDPTINSLRTTLETDRSIVTETTENTGIALGSTQITPVSGTQSTTDKTMHTFNNTMQSSKATTIKDNTRETTATGSTTSKSKATTGSETPTSQFTDSRRPEDTATTIGSTGVTPVFDTQSTTEVTFTKINTLTETTTSKSDTSETPLNNLVKTSEATTIRDSTPGTAATGSTTSNSKATPGSGTSASHATGLQFTDSQRTTEHTATTFGSTKVTPSSDTQATTEVTFTKINTLTEAKTSKSDTSQTPFIMTMETSEATTIKDSTFSTAAKGTTTSNTKVTTPSETPTSHTTRSQFTDSRRTMEYTGTTFGSTEITPVSGTQTTTEVTFTTISTLTESRTSKSDTSQTPFNMTMETSEATTIKDSTSTTAATAPCEGMRCPCSKYLYGKNCTFIQDDIRLDKVNTKLAVTVHVENWNFTSELEDKTSQAYHTFQKQFTEEIKAFYNRKISNFKDVKIIKTRNGSIVVDHEVLLWVNFRNYMEETKETEQLLQRYLNETICTSSGPDKLCFRANTSTVTAKEVSLAELCSEDEAIPEEMKMYFHGLNETTFLLCVTDCSGNYESPINCNWGQCSTSAAGPHCYCDISDEYWYTGSHCETPISKPGVIAGVTVGLVILVIIIVILVIALCRHRRVADHDMLLENGGNKNWYGFGWTKNLKIHRKSWNPTTDSKTFGPNGSFKSTKEKVNVKVNPQQKVPIPRPR